MNDFEKTELDRSLDYALYRLEQLTRLVAALRSLAGVRNNYSDIGIDLGDGDVDDLIKELASLVKELSLPILEAVRSSDKCLGAWWHAYIEHGEFKRETAQRERSEGENR